MSTETTRSPEQFAKKAEVSTGTTLFSEQLSRTLISVEIFFLQHVALARQMSQRQLRGAQNSLRAFYFSVIKCFFQYLNI